MHNLCHASSIMWYDLSMAFAMNRILCYKVVNVPVSEALLVYYFLKIGMSHPYFSLHTCWPWPCFYCILLTWHATSSSTFRRIPVVLQPLLRVSKMQMSRQGTQQLSEVSGCLDPGRWDQWGELGLFFVKDWVAFNDRVPFFHFLWSLDTILLGQVNLLRSHRCPCDDCSDVVV